LRPTKQQVKNGTFRYVGRVPNGEWYKLCTGPAHEEPEYLPATEKYFHFHKSGDKKGRPVARCRLCINWNKVGSPGSYHGLVPIHIARRFFLEAVNCIGATELARRAGISRGTVYKVTTRMEGSIQKRILRQVMLELTSIQRNGEHSISNQAKWRAQRKIFNGYQVCSSCGTPQSNYTADCVRCQDRAYNRHKSGAISDSEYARIREQLRLSSLS